MERATPVRNPHTSTADQLTWSEAPPATHSANALHSAARSHKPSDAIGKVLFGGQITEEEAEGLNKRKMLRYLKRKSDKEESSSMNSNDPSTKTSLEKPPLSSEPSKKSRGESEVPEFSSKDSSKSSHAEFNFPELPSDPGERLKIVEYDPNIREMVRRKYYLNGASQPRKHEFPQSDFNGKLRRFNPSWFDEFKWLEYSISKDSAFCLYCYLFKNECGDQGGGDAFVSEGFRDWKKKDKFRKHEGGVNSAHRQAWSKCQDLMNQKQHIEISFSKMTDEARIDYGVRLNASIDCIRFILRQGLPFRGHNEYDGSNNQGNFLELLKFLTDHNEEVRNVALKNAPENLKFTAPQIQKDIVKACAFETTNAIIRELGDGLFSVLLDESRDVSTKEQMAVVLRFVNKRGCVIERFLGLKHVTSTTTQSLKNALEELFSAHGLSISMLRGQGYDGASNMQGEFNGLKTLILKENECAYYVHCFAHQLQLALVAVAKNHVLIATLFLLISSIVSVVGSSCKRRDTLREAQIVRIIEGLENEEITSGRGLNQETTLIRPSDTRWGSHYGTLMSLINMFASVIDVLDVIVEEGTNSDQKAEALRLMKAMQSFEFVITLHLMKSVLGITNDLSQALQRKDQDIGNAIILVDISKKRLQAMRENGWNSLVEEVSAFCVKHHISIPNMDDLYVVQGRSRRRAEEMTNSYRYRVELFDTVIDMQLQELNSRFNEVNTKLLLCVACLNPSNSFAAFDKQKVIQLAQFYPKDFSEIELLALPDQLENFIMDMRLNVELSNLKRFGDITQKMVETRRDVAYPLVYKLLTLILILPIATATVERAFSGMKIVKNRLRNRMGDKFMNDCLVVYIEKDVFNSLSNESIMNYFQNMKNRTGQLKPCSGYKLKEITGSKIFESGNEDGGLESGNAMSNPINRTSVCIYQHAVNGMSQISFGDEEKVSPKKPTTLPEVAKQRELSGTLESESDIKIKKQLSDAKCKELSGHDIFGPPSEIPRRSLAAMRSVEAKESKDMVEPAPRNIRTSVRVSNPAGGQSNILFGEEPIVKATKKIHNQKFAELTGDDIFKGDAPPGSAEKPLSVAKLREMSGNDIFSDGKAEPREYLGGVRKPPGGYCIIQPEGP